mgnify:CR=1 FL=1
MSQDHDALLSKLFALVRRLYADTEGMRDNPAEQQLWYDRGYANGMVQALRELGYGERLESQLQPDPEDLIAGQEALAWGKAYQHGLEVGSRETHEVVSRTQE